NTAKHLQLQRFQMKGINPHDPRLELEQGASLIATADLAQTNDPLVGDQLQNGAQEVTGMNARIVTQLAGERNRHRANFQIDDFHKRMVTLPVCPGRRPRTDSKPSSVRTT